MLQNDYYIDINRPVSRQKIAELISKIKINTTPKNSGSDKKPVLFHKLLPSSPKSQISRNELAIQRNNISSQLLKRFVDLGTNSSFLLDIKAGMNYNSQEISERIQKIETILKEQVTENKMKDLIKNAFAEIQHLLLYHKNSQSLGTSTDRNVPYLQEISSKNYTNDMNMSPSPKFRTPANFSKSKWESFNFRSLALNLDSDNKNGLNSLSHIFDDFESRRKPQLKNLKNTSPDYLSFFKRLFELRKRLSKSNGLITEIEMDLSHRFKILKEKFRSLYIGEEAYKLWEMVEECLDEFDNSFINMLNEKKCEQEERKKVDELLKEKILLNKGEVELILNKPEREVVKENFETDRKVEFGEIFRERIKELENECSLLNENLASKEKVIVHLENKILTMGNAEKKTIKVNKGTQLSFGNKMEQDGKKTSNAVLKFISEHKNYFKFRFETSYSFVNLILIDKFLEDQISYCENLSIISFPEFLIKWILKKLGNWEIAKRILSDFIMSITNERHLRFVLMRRLLGIENSDNEIKKAYYQIKGFEILIKALFLYRKTAKIDTYIPFVPFGSGDNIMFPVEEAWPIFEQILIEEEITEENLEELRSSFNKALTPIKDVPALKKFNNSASVLSKIKNNQMDRIKVNFDSFIEYILEFLFEKFEKKINQICNNLSIISSMRKNEILFNDFENTVSKSFPKKSKIAIEKIFLKISMKHAKFGNINESLKNNSHLFLEKGNENYLTNGRELLKNKKDLRHTLGNRDRDGLKSGQNSATRKTTASNFSQHQPKLSEHTYSSFFTDYYDVFNSVLVLKDLHQMLELNIVKQENKNEGLFMNHQLFKKEFLKLSSLDHNVDVKNLGSLLHEMEKSELVDQLERLWINFRSLVESLVNL